MDLNNSIESKVQGVENDENNDVVAAFSESVVWWSGAKITGFCIWKKIVFHTILHIENNNKKKNFN